MIAAPRSLRFTLALIALLSISTGCRAGDDSHVRAMEQEHATDHPAPSPAATTEPAGEVESVEVVYATLGADSETEVRGYLSKPRTVPAGAPAVLLIHEWWGLNDNIRAVADRFAGEGYIALAIDLYEGHLAETREDAAALMRGTLDNGERLTENLRQAHRYLVERVGASKVGSIGWCFGGGWSLNAAIALGNDLDATVIYYGRLTDDPKRLATIEAPILGLFGALDQGIPIDSVRAFESALEALGKSADIHVYEDADHAFANPSGTRYDEVAATDAWEKTLAFFAAHLN